MHDPSTVAFEIKFPWWRTFHGKRYFAPFITIWHEDPETDGSDDSCGWFKRARHCDQDKLKAFEGDLKFDWDAEWGGYFDASGRPLYSVSAIVLNAVRQAAWHHYGKSRRKRDRFMRKHLPDILFFAENTVDSMHPSVTGRYGIEKDRNERIRHFASIIYPWVVRQDQKWWQHARWHFWHWRFQIHPLQKLKRRLFTRCDKCGKPFGWNESPIGTWGGKAVWHDKCHGELVLARKQPEAAE